MRGIICSESRQFSLKAFKSKWMVLFFYPKDFTFICPTEALGFNKLYAEFQKHGAEILGISADPIETHRNWLKELGGLRYPLLSDDQRLVCKAYDVLDVPENVARRATFIIDPEGTISYAVAYQANVGRSVEETLRVLIALQTGKLCPADWQPGEATGDGDSAGR